jgi:CRISPR-associated protein Csc3
MNPDAAREVHEWLVGSSGLYENIIDVAGEYDAKVDPSANCSLAAHILNAVTVGVNAFVFEAIESDADIEDEYWEDIKVLAAALALHDTNKYVREAYGFDADGNTKEAFEYYFDPEDGPGDDFDIEEFLGEGYREDLHYLVQRTEKREDSRETRGTDTKFGSLKRYCRLGDVVASVALRDGVEGVYDSLTTYFDEDTVHLVQFTELEQPVLNDLLLGTTKEVIAGEADREASGVVIGSSPDAVLYLGEGIGRETLWESVATALPAKIAGPDFSFSCKLTWNSFDYDILAEVEMGLEEKEDIIASAFRDLLERGSAGIEPFEYVSDEFDQYFPVLAKAIYVDGQSEFDDPGVQAAYDRIKDEQGVQKVKLHFIAYLVQHYEDHAEFLDSLAEEIRPKLHDDLEPESDAIGAVVDRFFDGQVVPDLGTKAEMCFLCGADTDTKYQKGISGIYRTQEYSRRVPPHAKYKSICEVCNLEYALLADICEQTDVSTNNALEVAYFYFDDFLGDVRLRRRRAGNVVQGDADEMDDTELTTNFVGPQYFLQPVYVLDENHRMAVVRQVMQTAREAGMKVVLGRPFTRFESADAVFRDEEATRPQELLGLDEVERFGPLPDFAADRGTDSHLRRALQLFKIMSMVGQDADFSNPYIHLDRDTFHSIADFAVVNHENATRLPDLREYFENYHEDALMDMKTVAERGIDLFGTTAYDSKYKKTKVFRETLDAILTAKSQGMEDKQFAEYVRGQVYAAANREKYAGYPDPEDVAQFVEGVQTYLQNEELTSLKKLSDWENALVNSYYYAVDQTLTN